METRLVVKGNHTRKTAAFVRACAAYCFITIPSLENILTRLNLYLISGRVAIANGALSQGRQEGGGGTHCPPHWFSCVYAGTVVVGWDVCKPPTAYRAAGLFQTIAP